MPETVRRLGLDVLKGVSIVLVVLNHSLLWPMRSGDLPSAFLYGIAFGSVAAFSAVAGYVQGLRPAIGHGKMLRTRARQLLIPWALWAPLYAAAPLLWQWVGGRTLPIGFDPGPWAREVLLGGGPLWFLPVLFVCTVVATLLDRRTDSWWPVTVSLGAYLVLALWASLSNTSPLDLGNGTFWALAPLYVASLWFGMRVARDGAPVASRWVLVAAIGAAVFLGAASTLLRAVHPAEQWLMWVPYGVGVVAGCAALLLAVDMDSSAPDAGGRVVTALARTGRVSLGLYIVHPLFVAPLALYSGGHGGVTVALLSTIVVFAAGVPLVEKARTLPVLRRFV